MALAKWLRVEGRHSGCGLRSLLEGFGRQDTSNQDSEQGAQMTTGKSKKGCIVTVRGSATPENARIVLRLNSKDVTSAARQARRVQSAGLSQDARAGAAGGIVEATDALMNNRGRVPPTTSLKRCDFLLRVRPRND